MHMLYIYLALSSLLFYIVQGLIDQNSPTYGSHQLITYVVDWDVPKVIPWSKLDHIAYAFAVPDRHGELTMFDAEQLQQVVEEAHDHGKGVSLAIGGWTGSIHFSTLVRTSADRRKFASKIMAAVEKYDLNGVNLDWEYPNDPNGISCNRKHPKDTDNFLAFIQVLRKMLDKKYPDEHKLITAAVSAHIFRDADRNIMENLDEGWADFMDAFYIMAYDINGVWSNKTSSNAPLHYGVAGQHVSVESSIQEWLDAGIPSDRLYLGVPFYGYTHKTLKHMNQQTGLNVPLDRSIEQIKGDQYDDYATDPCPGAKPAYSGEFQWRTIEASGAAYNASGWSTYWDQKTQTPFSYNSHSHQFITFDNPASLRLKAQFAQEKKLGGIMLWSLEMDDASNSLLNAIQDVRT
ncbi:chitinase [Mucor ambiguus]|uniref:Chitinase n=1 Tax=Mucor ambiguus TaxID=91626 RepID=A0A0C9M6C4_9FUNG|nr:chitinase [Mucor ambiguus]